MIWMTVMLFNQYLKKRIVLILLFRSKLWISFFFPIRPQCLQYIIINISSNGIYLLYIKTSSYSFRHIQCLRVTVSLVYKLVITVSCLCNWIQWCVSLSTDPGKMIRYWVYHFYDWLLVLQGMIFQV